MYAENDVPCTLLSLIGQANGLLFLAGQGDGTTDDLMICTIQHGLRKSHVYLRFFLSCMHLIRKRFANLFMVHAERT